MRLLFYNRPSQKGPFLWRLLDGVYLSNVGVWNPISTDNGSVEVHAALNSERRTPNVLLGTKLALSIVESLESSAIMSSYFAQQQAEVVLSTEYCTNHNQKSDIIIQYNWQKYKANRSL
jgi:hypothetical protein